MGWGEPQTPRSDAGFPKPISVAAADYLLAVEAERDRLRTAIAEALGHLDRHPPMHLEQCAPCRVRRILTAALEGGS